MASQGKEATLQQAQHTSATPAGVNSENQNIPSQESRVAWGAREIGRVIGRTERQAHYMLERGLIKSATKSGGRWHAGVPSLRREYGL
jgi:hypothetical protein